MQNKTYEVDIIVNDKPIRQFPHNGKIFVEAKDNCEYSIRIKNNTWQRILACCSVDGLDILTGKTAVTDSNSGYVINGYTANRFDGFRVSDNKVAKFVFGSKGSSYAASKEDGSEKNVGVIGVRLFNEFVKPSTYIYSNQLYERGLGGMVDLSPGIWCDSTLDQNIGNYCCSTPPTRGITSSGNMSKKFRSSISSNVSIKCDGGQSSTVGLTSMNCTTNADNLRGFDMGTKWGGAKESRVVEVAFEKGLLALHFDIFYASRQSLIEMGVPIGNEKQVSLPSSFADSKYAQPPKNWQG